jgi:hypothetical protein
MNAAALEYSTGVVHEGGRRCKESTLNDLVHLTPSRIPLMNPPYVHFGELSRTPNFVHHYPGIQDGSKKPNALSLEPRALHNS